MAAGNHGIKLEDMARGEWGLLDSEPGVYTQLVKAIGAKSVQVEELFLLNKSIFNELKPVHGLIFLRRDFIEEEPWGPLVTDGRLNDIYFAKQIINNACATQLIISLLMNCKHSDVDTGSALKQLKEFSISFDPILRGLALSNAQSVRNAHNSVAHQPKGPIDTTSEDEEQYHFMGFIPIDGRLYELDCLRNGPVDLGPITPEQDWLDLAKPIIEQRRDFCWENDIEFKLMALVSDRKMIYEHQMEEHMKEVEAQGVEMDEDTVTILRLLIQCEEEKMARYRSEMMCRQQGYLPFVITLLKLMSEENKIQSVFNEAKKRAATKMEKEKLENI